MGLKIAAIQFSVGDGDKESRLERMRILLDQTKGADLVVLPELWSVGCGSYDRYAADSEGLDGPSIRMAQAKAKEMGTHILAGSIIEREGDHFYNTAVFIGPQGNIMAAYRKIHLFSYKSREAELLRRGAKPVAVSSELGVFGLSLCFDLRFPELYRLLLDQGAKVFLVPAGWSHPRLEHWQLLTRVRAVENQCFLIAVNSVGANGANIYCGHSVIIGPNGKIISQAGEEEAILKAEIDLSDVDQSRLKFPTVTSRVL
ncbi:MAG: carbon-nitrogen family hydrolase [Elusimicrobia bacterium]|nr:carbon-nitrogen family hydrolase [Elusimicrobiota bacterium]